jgi:hypothetical protein
MDDPYEKLHKSQYKYANRIRIRFFPKEKRKLFDNNRENNQFYISRKLKFIEDESMQK